MEKHKSCQSCGMPLKKDPKGGGTNADGTLSLSYCSYCYVSGRFVMFAVACLWYGTEAFALRTLHASAK